MLITFVGKKKGKGREQNRLKENQRKMSIAESKKIFIPFFLFMEYLLYSQSYVRHCKYRKSEWL